MESDELKKLIKKIQMTKAEDNVIELKTASGGSPNILSTLSSFSNQDEGGIILLGIDENNGYKVSGVKDVKQIIENIERQCENIEPKVKAVISNVMINNKIVVSVEVPGIDVFNRPAYYKGEGIMRGSYVRVGNSDVRLTSYEVYSYEAFKKRIQDDKREVSGVDESLMQMEKVNSYLQKIKMGKPNLLNISNDKILELSQMKNNGKWTLAGVMLFSLYPQAYFKQLSIIATAIQGKSIEESTSKERFIDNKRIDGTLDEMLNEAMNFVKKNSKVSVIIDKEGKRIDRDEYPMVAIREAILNTLIHRDYSIHTEGIPISIEMYSDRIEIRNPGGIYGNLPVKYLGERHICTRNEIIANAMEVLGLTENRYSGIPTMRKELKQAGLWEPVFVNEQGEFKVIFYNSKNDENTRETITKLNKTKGNEFEDIIVRFCEIPRTRKEIVDLTHLSYYYAINVHLKKLIQEGKIGMTIPDKPKSSMQRFYTIN